MELGQCAAADRVVAVAADRVAADKVVVAAAVAADRVAAAADRVAGLAEGKHLKVETWEVGVGVEYSHT